jgi:hypothetical protein
MNKQEMMLTIVRAEKVLSPNLTDELYLDLYFNLDSLTDLELESLHFEYLKDLIDLYESKGL